MTSTPRQRRLGAVGVVLLLLGVMLAGLYRISSGAEHHSFSSSPVPPARVHVTVGHTYLLSVPGGVNALQKHGLNPSGLRCEWSAADSAPQTLDVSLYGADTKAIHAIGSFVAPVTGSIHVDCIGWGTVFVDNADNASGDLAGLFLVLCIVALTVGAAFGLSGLRSYRQSVREGAELASSEDEEIERLVHVVHTRAEDGETPDGEDLPR